MIGIGRHAIGALALVAMGAVAAQAQTMDSPAGGTLPSGVSVIGGVVTDLIGTNGTRVVSEIPASALFVGFAPWTGSEYQNPLTIGTQSGFDATLLASLGGGLSRASFRFSLDDGDSAPGDFDENQNTLLVNGFNFGNWSDVGTSITNSSGDIFSSAMGFPDGELATGFFSSTDNTLLTNLFDSLLTSNSLLFAVDDLSPGDNFYDFTQGIDASLIDVGSGPVVTPPTSTTPEPVSSVLLVTGLAGLGAMRRRRRTIAV
ncbi:MAG TPA: VPLPA-CTERM sorting domain-containing protein [Longimicrobiaceae bacterium]|nr:VPLPA-CTERM sorting domain-containing protein [Longimicrobiaceae bacterium]